MAYSAIKFWEAAIDVTGIVLCCVVILYIIKNMFKRNRKPVKKDIKENIIDFNEQVLIQIIKQQSEKSFKIISDVVKKEYLVFQEITGEVIRAKKEKPFDKIKSNQNNARDLNKKKKVHYIAPEKNHYGQVISMADSGMNAKEISEKLKIPQGEIDLIINLDKMSDQVNHEFNRENKKQAQSFL